MDIIKSIKQFFGLPTPTELDIAHAELSKQQTAYHVLKGQHRAFCVELNRASGDLGQEQLDELKRLQQALEAKLSQMKTRMEETSMRVTVMRIRSLCPDLEPEKS